MATLQTAISVVLILLKCIWILNAKPSQHHHRPKRVIHGSPTTPSEVPYQAMLQAYGSHACGGSIIGSHWVLTAAHCLSKYQWDISVLTVAVGAHLRHDQFFNDSTIYSIEAVYIPELFECPTFSRDAVNYTSGCHHDIAVIRTRVPFNFSESVRPIELANGSEVLQGETVQISGWGVSNQPYARFVDEYEIEFPDSLLKSSFQVLSDSQCRDALAQNEACFNPKHEMCTRGSGALSICYGDSGSPVTLDGKLVGVVSHSIPVPGYKNKCSTWPFPDTHTRVSFYAPWIRETMLNYKSSQWHLAVTKLPFPAEMRKGLVERAGCGQFGDEQEAPTTTWPTSEKSETTTATATVVEASTKVEVKPIEEYEMDLISVFGVVIIVLAAVGSLVYCVVRFVRLKSEGRKFSRYWNDEEAEDEML